jgi:hypothetical protein
MTAVPVMVMTTLNDEYGYIPAATKFLKYVQFWRTFGVTEKQEPVQAEAVAAVEVAVVEPVVAVVESAIPVLAEAKPAKKARKPRAKK